ncbi:response regulator [Flavobacterium saliperosum]|uniref:CheY chemotaxis protein or a CheY-like REC (Receiver) domain n=2 Tax=Flavobacterium saliperosum TaxID=329186 RepID=A0A1G4VF40_9FLAO|nr:response regulator [Flavobacterium saliperosum]SCX05842.1 CheY chemotaxis protein or a CheY-like REC (receiver) domain [Flavobacterium saliperosum]
MKQKTILIIDDSYTDRFIATEIIKSCNSLCNIVEIDNAQKGLDFLSSSTLLSPIIIFLDIRMPIMDGFGFLKHFDSLPKTIKNFCRIYMLSSSIDPSDFKRALDYNYVVDYLIKPPTVDSIQNIMKGNEN